MEIEEGNSDAKVDLPVTSSSEDPLKLTFEETAVSTLLGSQRGNSSYARRRIFEATERKRRKELRGERTLSFDHHMPSFNDFEKRQITTIPEEEFRYKKVKSSECNPCWKRKKNRVYKEKVASLKVIIGRLKQTYLADSEALQNNIPDETIQLFQKIHI